MTNEPAQPHRAFLHGRVNGHRRDVSSLLRRDREQELTAVLFLRYERIEIQFSACILHRLFDEFVNSPSREGGHKFLLHLVPDLFKRLDHRLSLLLHLDYVKTVRCLEDIAYGTAIEREGDFFEGRDRLSLRSGRVASNDHRDARKRLCLL